jgi:hypothetical protein
VNAALFAPRRRPLSRRTFLRGAGVALALPLLDAMQPALAPAAETKAARPPRRLVALQTNMGILPQYFFPEKAGRDYPLSPYLEFLDAFRRDLTVFSGVAHPDVNEGHAAEAVFLTAAPHPGGSFFRNSISLDQFAAERLGAATRFPTLSLLVGNGGPGSLSYTRSGVKVPAEASAAALYRQMFVQGSRREIDARIEDLRLGRSLLDFVADSGKRLQRDLGPGDRDRLDQYFTSVRELEDQLVEMEGWERRPKPKVEVPPPTDVTDPKMFLQWSRLMFETTRLALESDSTRLVTISIETTVLHGLTHHGNRPETIAELRRHEEGQMRVLAEFLGGLRGCREGGETLLDRTMVLYGTCLGSANSHANTNLPLLLAGGGFRHGQHLVFDKQKNYPLPNLFVSMLQRLGIETDRFASSTGTMRGLEMT